MKRIISVMLVLVMLCSCLSVLSFAESTTLYRDGLFEFYLQDNGAHIVGIAQSDAADISIPLRVCYDDDRIVGSYQTQGIEDDDNDAPDPFGSNYAYVTAIEESAFDEYTDTLESLSIPRYVSELDIDSLRLESLQSITVDDKNTTYASENGTLYNAAKTELLLHPQASSDGSIASTVKTIAPKAFAHSTLISAVTLPAGVTAIPERCFEGCTALASIDMSAAKVGNIGTYAFLNTALTSVNLGESIKLVNSFAFFGNSSLTELIIPQNAKNVVLRSGAFLGCPITDLTVYRSVTEIGDKAIGYYYDEDLTVKQYENLVITTYKYDAAMNETTALYRYAKANDIKFIPLDDIYCLDITYPQLSVYHSTMYLYAGNTLKYTVESDNGVFRLENIPRNTYSTYFVSQFGVIVQGPTIQIKTEDYREQYSAEVTKYEGIGDVNRDNKIDIKDVAAELTAQAYNTTNAAYDIDLDGIVGMSDISIILNAANFGAYSVTLPEDYTTPIIPM